MNITVLNKEQMVDVITMKEVIEADKDALAIYSAGGSDIPLRANLDVTKYEGQSLYMPGYAEKAEALGVKIVSVYPKNIEKGLTSVPATMVLLNAETGEVKSLMDGTYLTQLRTGAVSGAATDLLARKDSSVFALFGTGGQATTQLEAVLTVRPIKQVFVFDISTERAAEFAKNMTERFKGRFDAKISVAPTSDEAVKNADIITIVTTSKKPVFNGDLVKEGCHINAVGSYTPEMQELSPAALTRATKIYVDTRDGVLNESGDFIKPMKEGTFSFDSVTGELGELVLNKTKGRESEKEITLFKTTGSAVLDIVVAQKIYERATVKNVGQSIEL